MDPEVGRMLAASSDFAERSRTVSTTLINASKALEDNVGGLAYMLSILSGMVKRGAIKLNRTLEQNERLALEWENQQDITIGLAKRVRELEEQMGFKDVESGWPEDVKLAAENEALKRELGTAKALAERTFKDMQSWQAKAGELAAELAKDRVDALNSGVEVKTQTHPEFKTLEEKYETAQEMLKLYRRLVKLPQEDVGGGLTIDEYIDLASKTDSYGPIGQLFAGELGRPGGVGPLLVACLGLAGEVGEFVDHVKKYIAQGHELNKVKLADELGDVLWYWGKACRELGFSGDVVAQKNIEKLKKRFPEGFTVEASVNRKEYQSDVVGGHGLVDFFDEQNKTKEILSREYRRQEGEGYGPGKEE